MHNPEHRPSIPQGVTSWIRVNVHELRNLPAPYVVWTSVDLDPNEFRDANGPVPDRTGVDLSTSTLSKGLANGAIKRVDKCWIASADALIRVYQTDPRAYDYLETCREKQADDDGDGFLPCGCDAFENPRGLTTDDGRDAIRCKNDDCGAVHAKADVRAHNAGGERR